MSEFTPESSPESNPKSGNVFSSGVYKSKLFNFLNRRSQELMHQSKTVLRHLQVATIWGVQIALYPVYLLIQTGRNFAWQLQASAAKREAKTIGNQVDSQPILPSVDQPITQVLELVKEFLPQAFSQTPILEASQLSNHSLSVYTDYQSSTQAEQDTSLTSSNNIYPHPLRQAQGNAQPLSQGERGEQQDDDLSTILSKSEDRLAQGGLYVQGIANLLTSRKLVLVGNNNQILDILTPEQQQQLAKKIIWEIASYGYDRHRFLQSQDQSQKTFSQPLPNPQSPQTLLPAKWFWKLMAWVQRGEVAIAANLFQESNLTVMEPSINASNASINPSTNLLKIFSAIDFSSFPHLSISPATLQIVDQQVYEIEIKQITPASQWLNQLGEKLLPLVVSPQQVLSKYQHQGITNGTEDYLESNPANTRENIWALIQGAIAYFFGQKSPEGISADFSPNLSPELSHHSSDYVLDSSIPHDFYPRINSSPIYQELPFSEDDWLTSEDLFKTATSQELNNYEDEDMIDLPSIAEIKLLSSTNSPSLAQVMAQKKKKSKLPSHAPLEKKNTSKNPPQNTAKKSAGTNPRMIAKPSSSPKPAKSSKASSKYRDVEYGISNACDISSDLDHNNNDNWIETEVTSNGYVKHPLQKCLEILDDFTLWIEEFFGRIWQAIKKIVKA